MSEKTRGNVTSAHRLRSEGDVTPALERPGRAAQVAAGKAHAPAMLAANRSRRVDNEAIAAKVKAEMAATVRELGGEEKLTARQRLLLINQKALLLTVLSASDCLERSGAVGTHGRMRPVLATLGAYINALRLNVDALGLERSEAAQPSLQDAIDEFNKEKADAQRSHDH